MQLEWGVASEICLLVQVIEGEIGSPVDVAKSYMSARPPWASPCLNTAGQRCASPVRMPFSKEDALFSIGGNSSSPSKVQVRDLSPGANFFFSLLYVHC